MTRAYITRSRRPRRSSYVRRAAGKRRTIASSVYGSPTPPTIRAHFSPFLGPTEEGRPDAAHRLELYLQNTFGHAEGDFAGGRRRYWLARSRNYRTGHHAAAVIGETRVGSGHLVVCVLRSYGEVYLRSGKCRFCTYCELGQ
jgi:hypothetical protein